MSRRAATILDELFPESSPEFATIADAWPNHVVREILTLVWDGFDILKNGSRFRSLDFSQNYAQVERSLTDLHMLEIMVLWKRGSGFESFVPHHEAWEFETLVGRSRPPSVDLGFVLRQNHRLRWSVEAKVLSTSSDVGVYLTDLDKYLEGRASPFATEAALGAYLVEGAPDDFFSHLESSKKLTLNRSTDFGTRPHRTSQHSRSKSLLPSVTPGEFMCHHLVFALS